MNVPKQSGYTGWIPVVLEDGTDEEWLFCDGLILHRKAVMTPENEIEMYVGRFGENYRRMITSALKFLDEQQYNWSLDKPFSRKDRNNYIAALVRKVVVK